MSGVTVQNCPTGVTAPTDPTPTTKERPAVSTSLAHRLRHALSDFFALGYLAVCAGLMIWALLVTVTDDSGESMAGVIPALATAPFSLVMLVLPDSTLAIVASVVFGALVNATVIGLCARALRRGNRPDPA